MSMTARGQEWQLDRIERTDGRAIVGLWLGGDDKEVEFVEVVRPQGKPMFLVVHTFHPNVIEKKTLLPAKERHMLMLRLSPLLEVKSRRRIEAGRMEDVVLKPFELFDRPALLYDGNWFRLISTADEAMVRRAVVRVEQMFRAYRFILPPRDVSREGEVRPFTLVLLGSRDEYRTALEKFGLKIDNAAFFSAVDNLIVAGDDLRRYQERFDAAALANDNVRRRYDIMKVDFARQLPELGKKLRAQGLSPQAVQAETRLRRNAWNKEFSEKMTEIRTAERRNMAQLEKMSEEFFQRLYHESFHAYVENYVFPVRDFDTPRWLNEGLAQIFETGQLDAGALRLDSPDSQRLKRLQDDLQSAEPMRLADLLSSRENEFFAWRHEADESERYYLYAWGVAYFLVFEKNLLGEKLSEKRFAEYVKRPEIEDEPIRRFEQFTKQDLAEFEAAWRKYILALPSPQE